MSGDHLVTVLGPPEFDQYIAACHTCNWAGPDRWERKDASDDASEHWRETRGEASGA